jgi:hypothetical protein
MPASPHARAHAHAHAHAHRQVTAEGAERALRDLVFDHWQRSGCESFEDTLKLTSLVDFYLPYLPLERAHVAELARRALGYRGRELRVAKGLGLEWGEEVVEFIVDKVREAGWSYGYEGRARGAAGGGGGVGARTCSSCRPADVIRGWG